jgi:sugar/nucleoside kinase (ribokinase family)
MELTLYDTTGQPLAYIADHGENSIYLWKGHAVAYIDRENLYGWNGKHLGWFVDGVLYDQKGLCVGSVRERCKRAVKAQPAKFAKFAKYAKYARRAAPARPVLSSRESGEQLETFLAGGSVDS